MCRPSPERKVLLAATCGLFQRYLPLFPFLSLVSVLAVLAFTTLLGCHLIPEALPQEPAPVSNVSEQNQHSVNLSQMNTLSHSVSMPINYSYAI